MRDEPTQPQSAAHVERSSKTRRILGHFLADAAVAVVWAALIVAIVLFSGTVSQFAYVDF